MAEWIAGFQVEERLFSSPVTAVYRGIDPAEGGSVILKVLNLQYPTPSELARFRHEYALISKLDIDGVIKAKALERHGNALVMVLEDTVGIDLASRCKAKRFTIQEFLALAIKMVDILDRLHANQVIHKDLNPSNFIWNQTTGALHLIDFGYATQGTVERHQAAALDVLQGTLAYMSPEQTGRMNRTLDYRSDYYALGVTFYEMLSGRLPFLAEDPLELVHCHLARAPDRLQDLVPTLPEALSAIVLKLMAKGAEDRYQSAAGLRADLKRCKAQWVETGAIEPFALGQQDISDRFHVPQKLYGREKEIRTLLDTLDRAGEGASELLMVAGYSGVGKTVLIEEVHKPLAGRKGYYLSGKFDQYRRDIPYAEIVGAFRGLVQQILGERDEQIQSWRQKILAAVGDNGRVIIETIPEVEAIIGPQPAALEIGALEAEKRFNETFGRFVGVFCQAEHPVLLFLDDLQWADPATLKLIQLLMTDMAVHHLLIIGAYRDNEVSGSHPLMLALDVIQESRPVETIHLKPLHQKHTRDLVADAVRRTDAAVDALAALIYRKTNGSPFFISRLLSAVHDQGMLWFDRTEMRWAWDAERIGAMQASDNVVGLMVAQMQQVPSETQAFLRLASCLGTLFDVQMVARVAERPLAEVIAAFAAAIEEDLITPVDAALRFAHWSAQDGDSVDVDAFRAAQYRFAHDRILEAAYSQLSDQERLETHHRIGMTMVALWSDTALEDHVFDIVNQLNKATSLLVAREDQIRVARLNLNAAQRARTSMAHAAASIFLDAGIALLGEEGWQDDPDTLFALYYNKTECAFLCGQLPQSEAAFETTIARARNATDQLKTYELMMRIHLTSNKFDKGLALAREALPLYGIDLVFDEPEKMAALADQELAAVEARLTGRDLEPLLEAPVHGDESLSYCFAILFRVWTLAFLSGNLPTMNYAGLKMVSLTLDRGNDKYSSFGYIVFGMIEAAGKENYARAYELGMLAMTMNKRFRNVAAIPPINNLFGHIISHYNRHYREITPIFRESYEASLQSGEVEWGVWAASFLYLCPFIEGRPLESVAQTIDQFMDFIEKSGSESILHLTRFHRNLVRALRGQTDTPLSIDSPDYQEADLVAYLEDSNFEYGWLWYDLYRSMLCYVHGDLAEALHFSRLAEQKKVFAPAFMKFAEQHYYHGLILAACYGTLPEAEQASALQTISQCVDRLGLWASSCPDNYRHKYLLVQAELSRLSGDPITARGLYDEAIEAARDNDYLQDEALANELTGQFLIAQGRNKAAIGYLMEARYLYERWGALGKVAQLVRQFPMLVPAAEGRSFSVTVSQSDSTSLDLVTVINASQALSAEISLGKVLERLMRILQENAGAQNARLLLRGSTNWRLEADLSDQSIAVLQSRVVLLNARSDSHFPLALLRFVARSAEQASEDRRAEKRRSDGQPAAGVLAEGSQEDDAGLVVIDDLSADPTYATDPYVQDTQPRSVLCLPVRNRNRLVCILYLENNLATAVFDRTQIELLRMISSQIAISIDNARLYERLESQVAERTAELRLAKEAAEQAQARVASLLDHSGQGFLSFGQDLIVDPEFSRACVAMLGTAPAGQDAAAVLFAEDEQKAKLLRFGTRIVFKEQDPYQRDVVLSLFPAEITRGALILKADYTLLDNGHIMAVLTDVTEERRLEDKVEQEHRGLRMVVSAVTESRDFFDAVDSFREFVEGDLPEAFAQSSDARSVADQICRDIHTLKGTLNQFSFLATPAALHDLEEDLRRLLADQAKPVQMVDFAQPIQDAGLEGLFNQDLSGLRDVLGEDFLKGGNRVTLTAEQAVTLDQLASSLLQGEPVDVTATAMRRFLIEIGYLRKVPLHDLLRSHERVVRQVAARLEREIAPMQVHGGRDIWIDPDYYGPFLRALAHLFRNAVAHGIETPDDRLLAGKEEAGQIICRVMRSGADIVLSVSDDGGGIDPSAVRDRAVAVGLLGPAEAARLSEPETLALIFRDRVTIKESADLFSGRGVGLSAVRAEVQRLGGVILVESTIGVGSRFLITLPVTSGVMAVAQ